MCPRNSGLWSGSIRYWGSLACLMLTRLNCKGFFWDNHYVYFKKVKTTICTGSFLYSFIILMSLRLLVAAIPRRQCPQHSSTILPLNLLSGWCHWLAEAGIRARRCLREKTFCYPVAFYPGCWRQTLWNTGSRVYIFLLTRKNVQGLVVI